MTISFEGQVAIVTGAGNGLGRSHALALAERGAKVVINDLGGSRDGSGGSSEAAKEVVWQIKEKGGEAIAHSANVANYDEVQDMVNETMNKWGRVDMLINNAGILRDKSFANMDLDDFRLIMDVHVMGSVNCTKAVWDIMREQKYGRIVMTSSASGLYGNFGQAHYSSAKLAVIGLMNTLGLEGAKYDVRVNALTPLAGTRLIEDLVPAEVYELMTTESVTAGLLTLCDTDAPNRYILCAGAGGYSSASIVETEGIYLAPEQQSPEKLRQQWDAVNNIDELKALDSAIKQTEKFLLKAQANVAAK